MFSKEKFVKKKFLDGKQVVFEVIDGLRARKKTLVLFSVWCLLSIIWCVVELKKRYDFYHAKLSVADVLVLLQHPGRLGMFIFPFAMLIVLKCKPKKIDMQILLRYGSKRKFLARQMKESILYAILLAVSVTGMGIAVSCCLGLPLINWNSIDSIFFSEAKFLVEEHFVTVAVVIFVMDVLKFLMDFLIMDLLLWNQRFMPILWVVVIVEAGIESIGENVRVFHSLFSVQYELWGIWWTHGLIIVLGIVICIALHLLGIWSVRKKDIFG